MRVIVGDVLRHLGRRWEVTGVNPDERDSRAGYLVRLETNDMDRRRRLSVHVYSNALTEFVICTELQKQGFALMWEWPSVPCSAASLVGGSS